MTRIDGEPVVEASVAHAATQRVGVLEVSLELRDDGWSWSVGNPTSRPLRISAIALRWDAGPAGESPRLFSNGYQSWSPSRWLALGSDTDPSLEGAPSLVRAMHHADASPAAPHELRSELVGLLDVGRGDELCLIGASSGRDHDTTIRVELDQRRHVIVTVEAYLGSAQVAPGEARDLHPVLIRTGRPEAASTLLGDWAAAVGAAGAARVSAPFQIGWCSWYQYFHDVTEAALRENLALAGGWPFEVFQLDDGYQSAIGDWLTTNERFPSPIEDLASDIVAAGLTPGIWIAPFLTAPGSEVVRAHPDWLARHDSGAPLIGMVNEGWGGAVHVLDTTRDEVLAHLEATAAALVAAGYPYLKLDFTYAPSVGGSYADPRQSPAQRVRAGMEALRRGAGDSAFLLGCGLPLGAGIGVVDGMRIGPDVAPSWEVSPQRTPPLGYEEAAPATRNAWVNTLSRGFMHRRLWLNDPDCVMLRSSDTEMSAEEVRRWALAVGESGGMVLVSDDLALLGDTEKELLDEVVATGRRVDAASTQGR